MSTVALQGVSRSYGAVTALHPLDLVVEEGEFLTLLGPSGCGKTTTLRIIAGFVAPGAGRVVIGGDDVTRLPPNRRQIGMVFQDYALFPHMTVAENVAFALHERGVRRDAVAARVAELLDLVQLPGLAARRPAQLSGGQQQRVALARAIAHPPRVLLMDEPLGALDQALRETMQMELRRIQRALGITTVFVTHDQAEAMALSDSIAVMAAGRVAQRGTAQDVYERPASRLVAAFLGKLNVLDGVVLGPEGGFAAVEAGGTRLLARPAPPGPATLGVRPHEVGFAEPGCAPHGNALPGRVLSTTFAGNLLTTRVAAAGTEWLVETRPGTPAPDPGSPVTLFWAPERTMVFRD